MELLSRALLLLVSVVAALEEPEAASQLFKWLDGNNTSGRAIFGPNCKQHGSCKLCFEAGCGWCPTTNRCQGLSAKCGDKIADDEGCPPEDPNVTAFSLNESVRMMRYAYAAYYNKPEKHGLPSQIQVVHTFAYPLGLWDKAFGFVALDEVERKIVLAFRGSVTFTQLMVEIVYHTLVPWHGDKKIRVNEFFMWAADDLLPQITPVLQRLFKQCSDCQLHVTGHSLGASVAMFAAYNISFWSPRPPILYTFGQPRSSNGAFARMVEERLPIFFRVVNAADPVPHIPLCTRSETECADDLPGGYYHSGTEIWFPSGDYKNKVMCHFRECVGKPHSEDLSCSDGLGFPEAAVMFDHHRYWDVLKAGGFCGHDDQLFVV